MLWREWRSSALCSAEMEAVMSTELSSMPRKVRVVVGPSVFFLLQWGVHVFSQRGHSCHVVEALRGVV